MTQIPTNHLLCILTPPYSTLLPYNPNHLLAVSKVDRAEQGVLLRGGLAMLVLVQEDRGAAYLHAQLLDALLVVHREQEGLEARLGLNGEQDGEVLGEHSTWRV